MKRENRKGFTLVELLLVVTILGILAALVLPKLYPQAEKGRVSEAIGILSAIRQGEESYFLENGVYLSRTAGVDWSPIGMVDPNPGTYFNYSVTGSASAFTATATRNSLRIPSSTYLGQTVTLNNNGTFGGTHPSVPSG